MISNGDRMDDVKVSIIVPAFNTEKYLPECLDSVVNQTLKDIEIICIDNCSTDNTLNILNEYAKKDSRIKVIANKVNKGVANSRNLGLDSASGEYVGFVDSDDFIELDMFEKLYKVAKEKDLDMCMCKICTFEDGTDDFDDDMWYFALNCFNQLEKDVFNHRDTKEFMGEIAVPPYNKIYRKSIIDENNIRFPLGVLFEDEAFFYNTYLLSEYVSVLPESLYYYRTNREGSLITQTSDRDFSSVVDIFKIIRNIFIETGYFEEYKIILCNIFIPMGIWRYGHTSEKYHESFFINLKEDCLSLFEDKEIFENLPEHITDRVDNLINSSDWKEFDEKENFKDISVILTCYNDADTIEKSILSVINLDIDFEEYVQLIIVDDGSEDETREICEKYIQQYPRNILYLYRPHQGESNALHVGIMYSKGKHFHHLAGGSELKADEFSSMF